MSEFAPLLVEGRTRTPRPRWVLPVVVVAVLVLIAIVIPVSRVQLRNELILLETQVDTQWKQVENQLTRQSDLIPNLVTVTRSYAAHEAQVFGEIAKARARFGQSNPSQRVQTAEGLAAAVHQLVVVAEAYPNLKADRQYRDLHTELAGTQNRVAIERQRYNELVGVYNARLRMLPWRLIAWGLEPREYFETETSKLDTPVVDL